MSARQDDGDTFRSSPQGLPNPRSSFVGCEPFLRDLAAVVVDPGVSVTTVTGRGGAGKTRAAIEVARRLAPTFPDGVAFVALADITDPGLVAPAIVHALGLVETWNADPLATLTDALSARRGLLVLDNLEQVLGAAPTIAELASAAGGMSVLVTSRAALRISGERVMALPPLELPPPGFVGPSLELRRHAAIDLFCQRARAVDHTFDLDDTNAAAVIAICSWVDGLPLAIELAAGRSTVFAPAALLERLARHGRAALDVLSRGPVDTEARHRSVRETIAWSVDLLNPSARTLFKRLGILEGTWSFDDAEEVCGGASLDSGEVLDALASLVDFHLVEPIVDTHARGTALYSMLETVRTFAREQLEGAELDRLQATHATWFQSVAAEASTGLESADEQWWVERLDSVLVNLRVAHGHLVAHHDGRAAILAVSLGWYWLNYGRFVEGRRWLTEGMDIAGLPDGLAMAARMWVARYDIDQGGIGQSAAALQNLEVLEAARSYFSSAGDRFGWLRASDHLVHGLTLHEDTDRADELAQASSQAWAPSDGEWWRAEQHHRLAVLADRRGDISGGLDAARAGLAIAVEHGFTRTEMRCRQEIVILEGRTSDPVDSVANLRRVLTMSEKLGDARAETTTTALLAVFNLIAGDLSAAREWYHRTMARASEVGYWHAQRYAICGHACLAALSGDLTEAARWHGANVAHMSVLRRGVPPDQFDLYEMIIEDAQTKLGPPRFGEIAAIGAVLDDVIVIEECLSWSAERPPGTAEADPLPSAPIVAAPSAGPQVESLTARELDVLRLIADGLTNAGIGTALGISPKTVMHHSGRIYQKLLVRGRAEAVALAMRSGILVG